ncbi:MAG: threonine synthase [Alphaproteobacteria bacterium]|nr:threonine synthase [Alphaproteobacteria bacterium]
MLFRSTRSSDFEVDLRRAALEGLAPDGGLYLPVEWPQFAAADVAAMRELSYQDTAFRVLRPFLSGAMADDALAAVIAKAYGAFRDPEVVPIIARGPFHFIELFHGPTLAFKDVALQFVGLMFAHFLQGSGVRRTVLGATSGDTGSAAMAALAGREGLDVFILYPDKGPSDVQRKQMTCVRAPNVHALAIDGTFDDCQRIVKALFADPSRRESWRPTTVNSINVLRILAQVVYYVVASARSDRAPTFVVPTGNFGDIFAGYVAKKCGAPIKKLVVASNKNNILTRFFENGTMEPTGVCRTLSPSMDIQISSNFERLLFDLCQGRSERVCALMEALRQKGSFAVTAEQLAATRTDFAAGWANDDETLATIKTFYDAYGYVLDPHTAVGVRVAETALEKDEEPVYCLATAHPAKFPETIRRALGFVPSLPSEVEALISGEERNVSLPADVERVAAFIDERKKQWSFV